MVNKFANPLGEKILDITDAIEEVVAAMENKELEPLEGHKKVKAALGQLKKLKTTSKKNKKLDNAIERVSEINLRICKDFLGLDLD